MPCRVASATESPVADGRAAGRRRRVRRPRAAHREAASRRAHARAGHGARSATTSPRRATSAMKMRKAEELGLQQPPRAPARRRHHRARPSTRCRRLNDDPAVDAMLVQYPGPPQVDFDAVLHGRRPGQGRRRDAPHQRRPAGPRHPGPGVVHAGGHRGAPRPLRGPGRRARRRHRRAGRHDRAPAQHPAVAEAPHRQRRRHGRAHRRARLGRVHAAGRHPGRGGRRPRHDPARARQPRRGRGRAPGCSYEGRTLLPDVDEACEEVAGWITPRVGGVGPTTIAMLFRNFVEAAERHAGAAVMAGTLTTLPAAGHPRPRVVGTRLAGPPDADHDPARRRACTRARGTTRPGPRWPPSSTRWRPSGTPGPRPQRDAVVADALDRGVGDRDAATCAWSSAAASAPTRRRSPAGGVGCWPRRCPWRCCGWLPPASGTACWPTALGSRSPTGAAAAVVLVNCFLFPDEVDRVLAPDGVVVWVNSSGAETPIHLPPDDVVAALPGRWEGVQSTAGVGHVVRAAALRRAERPWPQVRSERLPCVTHDTDLRPPRRRSHAVLRALPAEDRRGRAHAGEGRRGAGRAPALVRVGHLRRPRQHPRAHPRRRHPHQPRAAVPGHAPPHLRGPQPRPTSPSCSTTTPTTASRTSSPSAAIRPPTAPTPAASTSTPRSWSSRCGPTRRASPSAWRPTPRCTLAHPIGRATAATWPPSSRRPTSR